MVEGLALGILAPGFFPSTMAMTVSGFLGCFKLCKLSDCPNRNEVMQRCEIDSRG